MTPARFIIVLDYLILFCFDYKYLSFPCRILLSGYFISIIPVRIFEEISLPIGQGGKMRLTGILPSVHIKSRI